MRTIEKKYRENHSEKNSWLVYSESVQTPNHFLWCPLQFLEVSILAHRFYK